MQQIGQGRYKSDYYVNDGGLNNTDSPFTALPGQAGSNSRNFEYTKQGAIKKRLGLEQVNATADTELRAIGLNARITKEDLRTLIRSAAQRIQSINTSTGAFTNLTEDTAAAGSTFWDSGTTVPVNGNMFVTPGQDVLWLAGGGASKIYGVYSDTKVTANGVDAPTGSITATPGGSGGSLAAGTYYYAVALEKASTDASSNAVLDVIATVTSSQVVTIDFTAITSFDTTKYDNFLVYRSSAGGSTGFTAGALVARVATSSTSYVDTGTDIDSSVVVPRAGNTLLDNSPLPAGDPLYTTVFKQRLVTAIGSTVYISDISKPESWPLVNYIEIPTGGSITGLGVVSFVTQDASSIDEILVVFKEDEMHIIQGTGTISGGLADWSLKFLDTTGCESHNSIVFANGYLTWLNRRGIFIWDGTNKPIYASRLIEDYFGFDGDISLGDLRFSWGVFYKKQNQVVWALSNSTFGTQKFFLKLDLRLTLPRVTSDLSSRIIPAVFVPDTYAQAQYAGVVYRPTDDSEERLFTADDQGFIYSSYKVQNDAGSGIDFQYETQALDQGQPDINKVYDTVIAYVEDLGDFDLTLRYWADYRTGESDSSAGTVQISPTPSRELALWDVAFWDVAFWDDFNPRLRKVVFHLRSDRNNTQGTSLRLRFEQGEADEPIILYGFSILYNVVGSQAQSRG